MHHRREGNATPKRLPGLPVRDIDDWYRQQSIERDRQKREALLYKIQQKAYDEVCFMPSWEQAFLCASGPRVAVSGLNVKSFAYSAPYEDVRLQ